MPLTRITSQLISIPSNYPLTGSLNGTASYATTASYALNGGSGGGGGAVQTGSIANQTILYNVTTSQDNVISGLNLSSNKWGVTVVEEWNSGSIPGDVYYNSCSLLMHFSGSNDSTTFIDNSPNNLTITSSNGAKITSSISKFGGTSGFFDGTNDYLTIASNSVFDLTGNYTIEFWAYSSNFGGGGYLHRGYYNNTNWSGLSFSIRGIGASIRFYFYATTNANEQYVDVTTPSNNIWHHFAMVKSGTTGTVYIDGTLAGTVNSLNTPAASSQTLRIGVWDYFSVSPGAEYFNGYMDEIRITKGIARYTGSFVTQSAEFYNNASVDQYATKYIGLVGGLNDSSVDYGVEKLSDSSLKIRKMTASGQPLSGSGALSASVDRVYVNILDYTNVMVTSSYALTASYVLGGIQTGSISNQTILYNVTTSQENTITGLDLSGNKWDVSVIEEWNSGSGDIYYPSCSLLMHFSGSNGSTTFIDNSPTPKSFTVNGNAQISTAQSKFGSSSLYLDGTGDYLTSPSVSDYALGTGDFTIECWAYRISGGDNGILQLSATAGGLQSYTSPNLSINTNVNGRVGIYANTTYYISTAISGSVNTWYHYALVRSSGVTKFYFNGNLVTDIGSSGAITDTTNYTGTYLAIGGYYSTSYLWNGYIDEFRITKGVARYTGSFTPQSVEFPNQLPQYETKYVGLVGGLNDTGSDYGVQKLSDSSLKIRKMSVSGTPVSGSLFLSASVDRVYVNVLNYKEVQTTAQSASYAVSSSYAITSSYLTDGSQILTSDRTVAFSSSFTTAQMQALIDAQPRNLGGKTLTFQFADGNYNLSTGLQFNFFSNGVLLIYGNSSNNTVAAAKNVTLSGSAPIYLGQNNTTTEVNYLRLAINTSTYASALAVENTNTLVNYCSFTNYPTSVVVGSGNGIGAQARSAVWVRNSYFTSLDRYMVSLYNGIITADTNSQGTNSNIAYLAYGGIIQVQNTGLTGTTTYSTSVGGLIVRPSGTTVGT